MNGASDERRAWQLEQARVAARWAVERWSGFPATAEPRPLVMLWGDVVSEGGFAGSDAKSVFLSGLVIGPAGFPVEVLRRLKKPVTTSQFEQMRPLRLRSAERARHVFVTDRGPLTLPAWKVIADDTRGPIWVLADDAGDTWAPPDPIGPMPPGRTHGAIRAEIDSDGVVLRLFFTGEHPEGATYPEAEVISQGPALAVIPIAQPTIGALGATGFTHLVGYERSVVARLPEPLCARVLVDLDASPIQVTTDDRC